LYEEREVFGRSEVEEEKDIRPSQQQNAEAD